MQSAFKYRFKFIPDNIDFENNPDDCIFAFFKLKILNMCCKVYWGLTKKYTIMHHNIW